MNPDRASATARLIAAATMMRWKSGKPGAPPAGAAEWCERFLSTSGGDRLLAWSARSWWGRTWWQFVESIALRGIVSHWMRRKREIDRLVRQSASEGFTQLVVLGAGLDTLAFRMSAERLYERVISADHPATLGILRESIRRDATRSSKGRDKLPRETEALREVELLPLDLLHDEAHAMLKAAESFDPARSTLVVLEGVLMYLPEPIVASVFRSLAVLPAPRLRLVASWMLAEVGQPIGFRGQSRLTQAWLRHKGEPMLWGSTPSAFPTFLDDLGWNTVRLINLDAEDPGGADDSRGLPSEKLVLAERRAEC